MSRFALTDITRGEFMGREAQRDAEKANSEALMSWSLRMLQAYKERRDADSENHRNRMSLLQVNRSLLGDLYQMSQNKKAQERADAAAAARGGGGGGGGGVPPVVNMPKDGPSAGDINRERQERDRESQRNFHEEQAARLAAHDPRNRPDGGVVVYGPTATANPNTLAVVGSDSTNSAPSHSWGDTGQPWVTPPGGTPGYNPGAVAPSE